MVNQYKEKMFIDGYQIDFRETMRAQQYPDVYAGDDFNKIEPYWSGSSEGDMNGDERIGKYINFNSDHFPPGTLVKVFEPFCPKCEEIPCKMDMPGQSGKWECGCDFDWEEWAKEEFS